MRNRFKRYLPVRPLKPAIGDARGAVRRGRRRRAPRENDGAPLALASPRQWPERSRARLDRLRAGEDKRAVRRRRRRPQLFGAGVFDDPSPAHDRDAIAKRHRFIGVMRDDDRGDVPVLQHTAQIGAQPAPERRINAGEGFVEQESRWPAREGARKRDPLLLPAGKLRGTARFIPLKSDGGDLLRDTRAARLARKPRQTERDILDDIQMLKENEILENKTDVPLFRRDMPVARGQNGAVKFNGSRTDRLKPRRDPENRRLAAARWPEKADDLAFFSGERDAVENEVPSVPKSNVAQLKAHGAPPLASLRNDW